MTTKITAIVICHKLERLVDRAVGSIVTQTRPADRIILFGSDCRLPTAAALEKWKTASLPLETAYSRRPLTCPQSKNEAARLIGRGEWFFTLDGDDWVQPHFIQRLAFLVEHGRYSAVGCDYSTLGLDGNLTPAKANRLRIADIDEDNPLPSCSMIRKDAFDEVGGYDDLLFDDWGLWIKLWMAGHSLSRYPQILFTYFRHPGSVTNQGNALRGRQQIIELRRSYGDTHSYAGLAEDRR